MREGLIGASCRAQDQELHLRVELRIRAWWGPDEAGANVVRLRSFKQAPNVVRLRSLKQAPNVVRLRSFKQSPNVVRAPT
jgi:hypothetical protein